MPFKVVEHAEYRELRFSGALDARGWESRARLMSAPPLRDGFLLDFTDATAISGIVHAVERSAERVKGRNWRIAILTPRPEFFGLARQTIQLASMDEGNAVNVFRTRDAAVEWLLSRQR